MPDTESRLLLYWPASLLPMRERMERAVEAQAEAEHRPVSISEWVREAVRQRLGREG